MAISTYDNNFRGVIGNKVYYKRNGKYGARTRRDSIRASKAEKDVARKLILAKLNTFAAEMGYVIEDTFPRRNKKRSAENEFFSLNYDCCTADVTSGTVTFAYEEMVFAKGRLIPPEVSVSGSDDGQLSFTVSGDTSVDCDGCRPDDKVKAIVLNTRYHVAMSLELGTRGDGGMKTQALNSMWQKKDLQVYVYAQNSKGNDVSVSLHAAIA